MTRLHIVVEGQTEETFVNRLLANHLAQFQIWTDARRVQTGRQRGRVHRGGVVSYQKVRKDLTLWMSEDRNIDAYFTTMLDFYALPTDFPAYLEAKNLALPHDRVVRIEQSFAQDIEHSRFIPYIQLHEFEALLFSDASMFDWEYLDHDNAIQNLIRLANRFENPELINDRPESAPSKRIMREIPEYSSRKSSSGPIIAEKIGLSVMRSKCPHFHTWLLSLEALGH